MATRVHEVKFPGDAFWTVLTTYVQAKSMQLEEHLLNGEYRARKDVYRFTINGYTSAIHDEFYSADEVIQFRCSDSGTAVFAGKIDPNYQQQIGKVLGPLVFEAEDNSYLLDEPVQTSFAYPALVGGTAYKIFDSGDTANSLVHQLLTAAGYNIATDIGTGADAPVNITTTIVHVSASADEATYWELIDDILHFHGYVMRWTADGKYTHENWAPAVVTSTHTFKDDLATNPALGMTKKFVDYDGVECEWCTLATRSNARLYQMSLPFNSDGTFAGESIAAGSEYPLGADTDDTYQDYLEQWLDIPYSHLQRKRTTGMGVLGRPRPKPNLIVDIDLIASSGHSIKDSYEDGITRTLTYESLRAKLYYSNPTGSTLKLWYSYIYGDALFRAGIKTTKSLFVAGATRLMPIPTRHLYNETAATKYTIARRNTLKYGDFTYSFASKTSVYVGSIATIQYTDPVTSIAFDTEVVIVGKKKSKHLPLYHYEAFGVAAYSVEAVDTEGEEITNQVYEGMRDSARATNLLPDASAYSDYDEIPQSDCEYWDLRQPDCKSHLNRSPESGYLTSFFPGHLYDEIKTEYNNAWAKFTGLGTIGVFKATENLVADPEDLTTWPGTSCTPTESDYYFGGRRFTKLVSTVAGGYRYRVVSLTGVGRKSVHVVLKKGTNETDSCVLLYATTAPSLLMAIDVNWTTKAVVASTGTLVSADWYGDDIVEVSGISISLTPATNWVIVYPSVSGTGTMYATAVQVEDSTYPTPYTPTERAAGAIDFTKSMPNQGTIECWVRSWFGVGITSDPRVFSWTLDVTHRFSLYYDAWNRWVLEWTNGGTIRYLVGTTIYTNTTLWNWIHLKVTWNISAGTGALAVNGVTEDSSWSGALDTFTTPIEILSVGRLGYSATQWFDGLITDVFFKDTVDTSTTHYALTKPYYDPDETANQYQSVRINKTGIRMTGGSGITMVDDINRLIDVSTTAGLLVRDAGGKIIHDIPDAPIQVGNWYLGHDLWNDDLSTYLIFNSTTFTQSSWTDITCLANNNNNVKKGIFKVYWYSTGAAVDTPNVRIVLRPKGSTWGVNATSNAPTDRIRHYFTSSICTMVERRIYLECPIGDDNKIQFYAEGDPSSISRQLVITQLGIGI